VNYTKGKWIYRKGSFNAEKLADFGSGSVDSEDGWHIALIHNDIGLSDRKRKETAEANAYLIAAAPKMYEGLKEIQDLYKREDSISRLIDKILAEVEGKENDGN